MESQTAADTVERRSWVALGVATAAAFLVVVDVSVVNVAFPSIQEDLGASQTGLSWIVSGYSVTVASFLLIGGRLADRRGRRLVFQIGVAVFLVGSLASGLAPNVEFLIGARVVQAVGGALITPASLAMVLPEFPLSHRSAAIGVWGAMGALGAAFGPSLGALLIEAFGWRWIFLINLPIGAVVLVATFRLVRESRDENVVGRLDVIGVPVGTVAIALIMVAIVQGEGWGYADARIVVFFALGIALLPVLIVRSLRHPFPLFDLDLFRWRSFRAASVSFTFYSLGFTSGFLMSSLLLQRLWDLSVLEAGFGLTPGPLVASFASFPAGRLADRIGHRWLVSGGALVCALAYLQLLIRVDEASAYWTVFLPANLTLGAGMGLSIASYTSGALSDLPAPRFAIANATFRTVQQVSFALGISVVVALFGSPPADELLGGFQRAWVWIVASFTLASLIWALTFPAGTAVRRRDAR